MFFKPKTFLLVTLICSISKSSHLQKSGTRVNWPPGNIIGSYSIKKQYDLYKVIILTKTQNLQIYARFGIKKYFAYLNLLIFTVITINYNDFEAINTYYVLTYMAICPIIK